MKFYPYEKGGVETVIAMLKGGGAKSFGVFFMWYLEVLAILKGGAKGFHFLKGGGAQQVLPCLDGVGGCKQFLTHAFPIV